MPKRPSLFLVDGSNNVYRSYFAIRGLTNSSGLATNAVYGFTTTLKKLLKDHEPDCIAVAFDIGSAKTRHEAYADYKKDRRPMPDDLVVQLPLVNEVLAGFRIPVIGVEDWEADDLIGSIACTARDRGYEVVIATSDKDFFQLVGDGIKLYHTGREVLYDAKGIEEAFGLPPEKVVDVMAIWGDAIDNIPGVPGIGEKGAKALIQSYGSLEGVYEHLEELKPAQRKKLEESREKAFMSRELARIKCDLEYELDFDTLKRQDPDRAKLHDVFSRLEFASLMQEFLPEPPPVERDIQTATKASDVDDFVRDAAEVAVWFESTTPDGFDELMAASLSVKPGESLIVPIAANVGGNAEISDALKRLLASHKLFVAHDVKQQFRRLAANGWPLPRRFADTMITSYVINPGLPSHALGNIARDRLKVDILSRKDVAKTAPLFALSHEIGATALGPLNQYLGEKSDVTVALKRLLEPKLSVDADLLKVYETIELPLIPILTRMERRGIRIDVPLLRTMSNSMGVQLADLEKRIYAEAGTEFNINSPQQLAHILFEKLQYPVAKKTKGTKAYSTSVDVLEELAKYYVVPQLILQHRELHKLKSTYIDALPQLVAGDGRVHTSFNQAVAATGRLSSSDPNLQNIPIRTELGREIRKAFVADDGNVLLAADYSQVELRILAHISQDESLIETFRRGADIHRATASKMFNIPEDELTHDQRRAAKTINFGVLYGMSAFRLSNELNISGSQAKDWIEAYFSRYPKIQEYLDRTLDEARKSGKVTTLFGRVRYIPEIHNKSFTVRGNAERMATNAPIQGTAADILKLAMIALEQNLPPDAKMLLTVHDEIVIEVAAARAEDVAGIVKETMENIYPLAVPLAVDTHWGPRWYDAKD
ncbi:MAG: DNA polymerase I [Acidobacteriota bacterium]